MGEKLVKIVCEELMKLDCTDPTDKIIIDKLLLSLHLQGEVNSYLCLRREISRCVDKFQFLELLKIFVGNGL